MKIQRSYVKSLAIAVAIAAAMPVFAASEVREVTTKKTYVFYGDKDIYYAPDRKVYFYRDGSGGEWKTVEVLPNELQTFVKDGGVTIELATEKPYEQNEYVVKTYSHRKD